MSFLTAPAPSSNILYTPVLTMNTNHVLSKWTDEENQSAPFTTLSGHRAFITSFDAFQDATLPDGSTDKGQQANIKLLTFPYGVSNAASETTNDDNYDYLTSSTGFTFPLYKISDKPDVLVLRNGVDPFTISVNGDLGYQLTNSFDLGILHHSTGSTAATYSFQLTLTLQDSSGKQTPLTLTLQTANGGGAGASAFPTPAPTTGISSQNYFKDNAGNTQFRVMDDSAGTRVQTSTTPMTMGLVETHVTAASILAAANVNVSLYRLMSILVAPLTNPANDDTLVIYSQAIKNDGIRSDNIVQQQIPDGNQQQVNPIDVLSPKVPQTSMNNNSNYDYFKQSSGTSSRINFNALAMGALIGIAAIAQYLM